MKTNNNTLLALISTAAISATLMGGANAAVIIEDTFSRTGSIGGSNTDTGQTWINPHPLQVTDGTSYQAIGGASVSSISGITFLTNGTYKLSMDVSLDTPNNFWIGLGYGVQHTNSKAFMIHEQGNAGLFNENLSSKQTITLADTNTKNFEITLLTGATLSSSTASWKIDGTSVGSAQSIDASGLNGVFVQISGSGLEGTVDNFKLTHVPEPSSTLLLGLGGLGLILRRRRLS